MIPLAFQCFQSFCEMCQNEFESHRPDHFFQRLNFYSDVRFADARAPLGSGFSPFGRKRGSFQSPASAARAGGGKSIQHLITWIGTGQHDAFNQRERFLRWMAALFAGIDIGAGNAPQVRGKFSRRQMPPPRRGGQTNFHGGKQLSPRRPAGHNGHP